MYVYNGNGKIYKASNIAQYVVITSNNQNIPITHLRLQKLLYYIKHLFLKNLNRQLFLEFIEAWTYGPVVPDIYDEFRSFGGLNISNNFMNQKVVDEIEYEDRKIIDEIVYNFKNYTTMNLVNDTHRHKGWIKAYNTIDNIISEERIEKFYE